SGSTHAQALGRRLLIEIRPDDTPASEVQVVCHEGSHYLIALMSEPRRAALEARAWAHGTAGRKAWTLLHEALPTALGQGLATATLTPDEFDMGSSWYHIPSIDRFAKQIYPIVRREVESKRTIDGAFLDDVIREYERIAPSLSDG